MHRMRFLLMLTGMTLGALVGTARRAEAELIRREAGRAHPDIAADINGSLTYQFNPATGSGILEVVNTPYLIAGGPTARDEFPIIPNDDGGRRQVLSVALSRTGQLIADAGNSFALYGTVTVDKGTYSGLLLKGVPTAFGVQDVGAGVRGGDIFDLNLAVTGGVLAEVFGSDAYLRITPELAGTYTGSFDRSFTAAKAASNLQATTPRPFPVAEPATFVILLAGGLGLIHHQRRRLAGR